MDCGIVTVAKPIINFLDLPDIVKEKVLSYLSFEELAHLRIVCRRFNQINQLLLNKGFRQAERFQAKCLREVKSQLPRRESERRNHPLFRHCDILTAIETRLSLLSMTFIKYIDTQMCCFIPGKVIDEINRVLRFIQSNKTLPRAHEILTELRDISSMAMEHFEEKIIPSLKPSALTPPSQRFSLSSSFSSLSSHSSSPGTSECISLRRSHSLPASSKDLSQLAASNKIYKSCIMMLKKEVSELRSKLNEMRRKVSEQEKVALEQNRIIAEHTIKLASQERKNTELNRKLLDFEQQLREVMGELTHIREKQLSCSSSSSGSWEREDSASQQYYASHGLPNAAISSAVFVPASIVQPSLVNLAAAPLPPTAYLPSSPLAGFSSGLTLSSSPGQESSLISPPAGFSSGCCTQSPAPICSTPLQKTSSHGEGISVAGSSGSNDGEATTKLHNKKHKKRRYADMDINKDDSHTKRTKL